MSNSEDSPVPPPPPGPPPGRGSKNDRPGLGVLPFVLLGVLILGFLMNGMPDWNGMSGEEKPISEFFAGLESKQLGPHNVFKARFARGILKYQDKPDAKTGWMDIWAVPAPASKEAPRTEVAAKDGSKVAKDAKSTSNLPHL